MTTANFEPLSVAVPLWEDPPVVFRVGDSRVLLELVAPAPARRLAAGILRQDAGWYMASARQGRGRSARQAERGRHAAPDQAPRQRPDRRRPGARQRSSR
jgi:hypothetical protein